MINLKPQNQFTLIKKFFLIAILVFSLNNITLADEASGKTPDKGTAGNTQTVTIPPIIPVNDKVYIPVNNTGESNKNYLQNRLLPNIASVIIAITGGLSLVFVIISGLQLLTAYANPDQATAARKTLIFALVGLVIASLSYGIVAIIASITV
jgi:hypothetical protein